MVLFAYFFCASAYIDYMLKAEHRKIYRVQAGQTLKEIACFFGVSEFLLAKCNHLNAPPKAGQILFIPNERGNAYVVKAGDTKALLCGSVENFERKNGTDILYLGMRVIL